MKFFGFARSLIEIFDRCIDPGGSNSALRLDEDALSIVDVTIKLELANCISLTVIEDDISTSWR